MWFWTSRVEKQTNKLDFCGRNRRRAKITQQYQPIWREPSWVCFEHEGRGSKHMCQQLGSRSVPDCAVKPSRPAGMPWTVGGHLGLHPSLVFSPAAHLWDFHHCDLSWPLLWFPAPAAFDPISSLGPCLRNSAVPLAQHPLYPSSRPPPQAALHLIPCFEVPGQLQPHPGSVLCRAKAFDLVWFLPRIPLSPSSCHFERKSRTLSLNKTNKLTNILKSQSLGQKIKTNQN